VRKRSPTVPCIASLEDLTIRVDSKVKEAAEKAAAYDHRSLTSLIEKLLTKYLEKRRLLSVSRRPSKLAARTALKLAAREIESIDDESLSAEERESRKRRLIRGIGRLAAARLPHCLIDLSCPRLLHCGSLGSRAEGYML
jgi:hypothetical protein